MANKFSGTNFQKKRCKKLQYLQRSEDHAIKIVKRVLERKIREFVNIDEM